jgi:O-succinylbenzoate synthase
MLGGAAEVPASAAIAVDSAGRPDSRQIAEAVAAGYRNLKLKITPATAVAELRQIISAHPEVGFGADANGSFGRSDWDHLEAVDSLGLVYLEQPGSRDDLAFHCEARARLRTPIALDESAADSAGIAQILDLGAADVITLKVGLLGTSRVLRQAQSIAAEGIGVRLGGLIESGIGRAHTAALAGNPVFAWPSDVAGSDRYFADDLVRPHWRIQEGSIRLSDGPGIGVAVAVDVVIAHSLASLTAVVSG